MKLKHKVIFLISIFLAIASWMIVIYYWDKLPQVIPVHFGVSGQADNWADKSFFYVFLMPLLQSIMLISFVFLYYKPQYSSMPTTMWLMTLDKKHRNHAFELIRTMLAGVSLWVGILLTYIIYGMNVSALDNDLGLSPLFLVILVGLMLIWLAIWNIKVYKATKEALSSIPKSNK